MRKPIIVGNWKMNKTCAETVAFIEAIEPVLHDGATFGVGAPFTALKDACATAKNLVIAAEYGLRFQFHLHHTELLFHQYRRLESYLQQTVSLPSD